MWKSIRGLPPCAGAKVSGYPPSGESPATPREARLWPILFRATRCALPTAEQRAAGSSSFRQAPRAGIRSTTRPAHVVQASLGCPTKLSHWPLERFSPVLTRCRGGERPGARLESLKRQGSPVARFGVRCGSGWGLHQSPSLPGLGHWFAAIPAPIAVLVSASSRARLASGFWSLVRFFGESAQKISHSKKSAQPV